MTASPERAAGRSPAGQAAPPGPSDSPVADGPGTLSSLPPPDPAAGTPPPDTGAAAVSRPAAPARGRSQTPAVGAGASPAPSAGSRVIAAAMSEAELLSNVTLGTRKRPGLCELYGLTWYHTYNSQRSPSGFPDLVIAGRWVMYRELKRQKENPTKAQREWIAALEAAGADVGVYRPSDWLSGRIQRELTALAGLGAGKSAATRMAG